jgi:4-hydroxybenzoate polyprenyltransferase
MDATRLTPAGIDTPKVHVPPVQLFADVCRFGRFSVLGFSLMLPMIGAAAVSPALTASQLVALAAVGFAFHIFAYVSNDVFDLPIDRTQPLRSDSPLVRGLVPPPVALAIASIPVPLACLILLWTGVPPAAIAALIAAAGLMLVYNRFGKRIWFPPLSDAIQGLGWVALALYGALATGWPLKATEGWFAATVFVYVLMINGLHGDLRDLANDAQHGARTTALYLGARTTADGKLIAPPRVVIYGLTLQILLLLLVVLCIAGNWAPNHRISEAVVLSAVVASHVVLLWLARAALRPSATRAEMLRAGILHLFLSLGAVLLPFAFFTNATGAVVIVGAYALPLLILCLYLAWNSR